MNNKQEKERKSLRCELCIKFKNFDLDATAEIQL